MSHVLKWVFGYYFKAFLVIVFAIKSFGDQ